MMQLLWCWWREAATLLSGKINFNLTVTHYIINKLEPAAHDAAVTSQNKVVFKYLLTLKLQKSTDDLSKWDRVMSSPFLDLWDNEL